MLLVARVAVRLEPTVPGSADTLSPEDVDQLQVWRNLGAEKGVEPWQQHRTRILCGFAKGRHDDVNGWFRSHKQKEEDGPETKYRVLFQSVLGISGFMAPQPRRKKLWKDSWPRHVSPSLRGQHNLDFRPSCLSLREPNPAQGLARSTRHSVSWGILALLLFQIAMFRVDRFRVPEKKV